MSVFTIEYAAEICHEANRAYCKALGDNSQPPWSEAPEWQRRSAIDGVYYHLETPEAAAADSHNNWLRAKEADGWKYGPEKDPEAKTHPCMVPFHDLPEEQQTKDRLFVAIVNALRPLIGQGN